MRVAAAHGVLLISITFFGISDGSEIESTSSTLHQIDLPPAGSRLNQCKLAKLLDIKDHSFNLNRKHKITDVPYSCVFNTRHTVSYQTFIRNLFVLQDMPYNYIKDQVGIHQGTQFSINVTMTSFLL